jgi:hypothetical protein
MMDAAALALLKLTATVPLTIPQSAIDAEQESSKEQRLVMTTILSMEMDAPQPVPLRLTTNAILL